MFSKGRTCHVLITVFAMMLLSCRQDVQRKPVAGSGFIDLAGYDFQTGGPINLDCRWGFYWKQLLSPADFRPGKACSPDYIGVPGMWNGYRSGSEVAGGDGFATYRIVVKNMSAGYYGLKIPSMATAYRLWVNDREVARNGIVAPGREMVPQQMPAVAFFAAKGEDVAITVNVSNYMSDKGGMWESLKLGTEQQVLRERLIAVACDLLLFGSILFMSLYHFGLFLFRRKDRFTLWFGLVCLVISIRIMITGEFFLVYLFPAINWYLELKLEFLTVFSDFAFFLLFLDSLYGRDFNIRIVKLFVAVSAVFSILALVLQVRTIAMLLPFFHLIIIAGLVYMVSVLVLCAARRRNGAVFILAGFMILILALVNDILDSEGIIYSVYLYPWGLLVFCFSQSLVLSGIFSRSLKSVEYLSVQLGQSYNRIEEYNKNLEFMISERTSELAGANEKLREQDEIKTRFFSNISHDLRTPLTIILGPVDDALEGKPLGRETLQSMQRNGRNLMSLINDLLDMSRITSGMIRLDVRLTDMRELVTRCCMDMQHTAQARRISMECIPGDLPVHVYVDNARIVQVLYNFFSNSFRFTGPGGIITVRTGFDDGYAVIEFSDTGCGIPSDRISYVFDRFAQAWEWAGINYGGNGLGLSIVKELVELHCGTVSVESRHISEFPLNHGTVFTVKIPPGTSHFDDKVHRAVISDAAESAASRYPVAHQTGEGVPALIRDERHLLHSAGSCLSDEKCPEGDEDLPVILVVDDDREFCLMLENMLAGSYRIIKACDGREAMNILNSSAGIDLVLSDIMMPGMDGYELLRQMRSAGDTALIPLIFLTGRADQYMKIEALGIGAVDYVTKPFNSAELILRIRNQMEQQRMRGALRRNLDRIMDKLKAGSKSSSLTDITVTGEHCGTSPKQTDGRMGFVCSFIREHFTEDLTRENLSGAIGLSPDSFSRLFNQYTGSSLSDYINEVRIHEARKMLRETSDTVIRISLDTGFDSIRTFNRVFKRHTGMNPGEYRESVSKPSAAQ